ncbi:MAG TPA: acetyl-CoA carboxylase carboxyl transferase subunit beta [Dehalococcoidia bacterium]|jgi:acetyl-CoA carboxylase carboxyl transferase subunit beta|nr:acetyl-CoA carboxylase carboxyl transferase subunit beta [Dehalococcoidia bacterium]
MSTPHSYPVKPSASEASDADLELIGEQNLCLACGTAVSGSELYQHYAICPNCRFHFSLPAQQRLELLADPGSFKEVNRFLPFLDPLSFSERVPYRQRLVQAQHRTGLREAVVTGTCRIGGNPAVLAILDFGFLGGSLSCVVGEKLALAFELALRKKLPIITVVSSGGARIQEGVLSLMQMGKTAAAARRLHPKGIPFISVLASPTTGEAYASFANLADIIIAEPGAIVGLAPFTVVEKVTAKPLPPDAHTAESHLAHGLLDLIVDRTQLRHLLSVLLDLLSSRYRLTLVKKGRLFELVERPRGTAWQAVQLARHQERPTALDYIARISSSFVEIHGDRVCGDDQAIVCGLADISGEAVVVIAEERGRPDERGRNQGRAYPEGFRKAQRAMRLAAKFQLPLITFIDTPGAFPGLESEERGIGNAIANCMALMSNLPCPVLAVLIGEGGSEGALALGVADRILMLENAIYYVVAPERAATILYREPRRAAEIAPSLKLTAHDCRELGVVDLVIPEPEGGAHTDPDEAARLLKKYLLAQLLELQSQSPDKLTKARYQKFRRFGQRGPLIRSAISKQWAQLQYLMGRGVDELIERLPSKPKEETVPEKQTGSSPPGPG